MHIPLKTECHPLAQTIGWLNKGNRDDICRRDQIFLLDLRVSLSVQRVCQWPSRPEFRFRGVTSPSRGRSWVTVLPREGGPGGRERTLLLLPILRGVFVVVRRVVGRRGKRGGFNQTEHPSRPFVERSTPLESPCSLRCDYRSDKEGHWFRTSVGECRSRESKTSKLRRTLFYRDSSPNEISQKSFPVTSPHFTTTPSSDCTPKSSRDRTGSDTHRPPSWVVEPQNQVNRYLSLRHLVSNL